jgi:hypothetical protein
MPSNRLVLGPDRCNEGEAFEQEVPIRRCFRTESEVARMNLTVHLPHAASWAAFFTMVAWMFVPPK